MMNNKGHKKVRKNMGKNKEKMGNKRRSNAKHSQRGDEDYRSQP